ncbi:type II toxin-antitoxin system YhaV family toxin [Dyella sp. KRB-257]|uniref:type II toxin-antitoxin system YhaV family toxin n=1 Tax=Dyella sp. KRB-257 TaxID=3400915 RepID=UPI003C09719D
MVADSGQVEHLIHEGWSRCCAWANDEDTRRACKSSDDAYRVFRKMLKGGHPPDDWDRPLAHAQKESQRTQESLARAPAVQ